MSSFWPCPALPGECRCPIEHVIVVLAPAAISRRQWELSWENSRDRLTPPRAPSV
jgi:hypothetical protein